MTNEKDEEKPAPYVRIIEQPTSKGIRFRYECEGRFAGSLEGEHSTMYRKTHPTIKIENYKGPAFIVVSCVSKDPPYYPHPHNLVSKAKEVSNGICYFKTDTEDMVVSFANLGIQCVTRKGIESSLWLREKLKVDPFRAGYDQNPDSIDLYCLRLCFQVFIEGQEKGIFNVPLPPIVSDEVHDKRVRVEPVINFISHNSASAAGGTEICILCEKATKDDIEVRFFRKENNWEAIAEFTPPNVYKQAAVVFKSPKYIESDIDEPVSVRVQLRRLSDGEVSDPVPFLILPAEAYARKSVKRKRPMDISISQQIQAEAAKNADLLGLANLSRAQNNDGYEPWELPPTRNKSANTAAKSPAKTAVKPAAKTAVKARVKTAVKPSEKTKVKPPAKTAVKTPAKAEKTTAKPPAKSEKTTVKPPAKTAVKSRAKTSVKPPAKTAVKSPAKTAVKPPAKASVKSRAKTDVKSPTKAAVNPPKSPIPVITINNNELNAVRNQVLKPATLAKEWHYNNNIQTVPSDYSTQITAASQKSESKAVYQPLNSISKSQQYQNSTDTLNSDSWIKDLIDTIDPKCTFQLTSSAVSKDSNKIAPEPATKFIPIEQTTQNTILNMQETDNLLEAEGQAEDLISEIGPISGSLSGINISDLIKDIGNGIAGVSADNIINEPNFDILPPLMEVDDTNQPIDIPIEALKAPYLLT